jgi:hypothetical protein
MPLTVKVFTSCIAFLSINAVHFAHIGRSFDSYNSYNFYNSQHRLLPSVALIFGYLHRIRMCFISARNWIFKCVDAFPSTKYWSVISVNPLTPELNPSAQRCLMRFFAGDFASWTEHFVNICAKNQQIHQLFIQFINYAWLLLHVSALHCHLQAAFLVPSDRCSNEEQSLDTTRPSTIFYRLILNLASHRRH